MVIPLANVNCQGPLWTQWNSSCTVGRLDRYSEVSISNRLLLFIIRHFLQLMTLNRCRLLLKLGKFSVLDFYLMPTFIDFQHFQKDFSISTIIITINIDIYLMNRVNSNSRHLLKSQLLFNLDISSISTLNIYSTFMISRKFRLPMFIRDRLLIETWERVRTKKV